MATKRISELTLRSDVDDTCNLPTDDTLQSYRVTALQVWNYIRGKMITTTGDIPYSSSGSATLSRLPIGTTGQILTVAGGLPSWATAPVFPGYYHASVYYPGSGSNYWSRSNAAYGDLTVSGTIPTPTTVRNANFGTISKAASNLPGIAFTAPRTGVIKITATLAVLPTQSNSVSSWSVKMVESVTATDIAFVSGSTTNNSTNNLCIPATMVGYFSATAATAYNLKMQSSNGVGTLYIGAAAFETCLAITMEYIT